MVMGLIYVMFAHTRIGKAMRAVGMNPRAAQIVGIRLYLDADAGAVNFYKKLGFVLLGGDKTPEPSPMFITLSAIS